MRRPLATWSLALWLLGCAPQATQLVVIVRSDLPSDDIQRVEVQVVPGEPFTSPPAIRDFPIGVGDGREALPFSFGVLPRNGDATSRVEVLVSAYGSGSAPTVTRLVRTGFSAGRALAVPVFLSAICRDRAPCADGLTCVDGACVTPDVPVDDLIPITPGRELMDAGAPDVPVSDDAGVGLPPPTVREVAPLAAVSIAPNALAIHGSGDPIVGVSTDPGGASGGVLGAPGTDAAGGHVVRITPGRVAQWATSFTGGSTILSNAVLSGERLFVCGDFDGTLTPEGRAPLVAPDDGELDRDDGSYIAELDARDGTLRWVVQLSAGADVRCSDLAVSGTVLGAGITGLDGGALLSVDGTPVVLGGCASPYTALLLLDVSGATPVPRRGWGLTQTAQGGLSIDADGAGGFVVGATFFGTGDQVIGGSCASGPAVAGGVLRISGDGTRRWGTLALELTDFASLGVEVVRVGPRVVALGSPGTGTAPYAILSGGTTISPSSTDARIVALGLSLADGALDGGARVSSGGAGYLIGAAAGPDLVVCGLAPPDGLAATVDVLGRSFEAPRYSGFLAGVGPDLSARWLEIVTDDVSAIVTSCVPDGEGGVWAGAVAANGAVAFGQSGLFGGLLAHLTP